MTSLNKALETCLREPTVTKAIYILYTLFQIFIIYEVQVLNIYNAFLLVTGAPYRQVSVVSIRDERLER